MSKIEHEFYLHAQTEYKLYNKVAKYRVTLKALDYLLTVSS